jgi:uncharacterized membrane protein
VIPLLLAAAAALLLRLLGRVGRRPWSTWRLAVRHALGVTFVLTGLAHFGPLRTQLASLLPAGWPAPVLLVVLAGVLQVAGGIALFTRTWCVAGAWLLVLVELAKLPANLNAARHGLVVANGLPTPPALRVPLLACWIAALVWATSATRQPASTPSSST